MEWRSSRTVTKAGRGHSQADSTTATGRTAYVAGAFFTTYWRIGVVEGDSQVTFVMRLQAVGGVVWLRE